MSRPKLFPQTINPVLLDLNEMERGKSEIFPFPFHSNQVKQDLSFFRRIRDGSYFTQFIHNGIYP